MSLAGFRSYLPKRDNFREVRVCTRCSFDLSANAIANVISSQFNVQIFERAL